jgi:exodeoxyribonuclease VIII
MPTLQYTCPDDAYRAHEGLGSGDLKRLLQSPAHFRAGREGVPKETPALLFGRALHALVLEGRAAFATRFAVRPEGLDARTRDGKAWLAEQEAAGKAVLTLDEQGRLEDMVQAIDRHPAARDLLRHGDAEVSAFWTDRDSGAPCKARFDWLTRDHSTLVDLKTCQDASPAAFAKQVASYGYHIQASHYLAGHTVVTQKPAVFAFVAVEKAPPYAVGVYCLDFAAVAQGERLRQQALQTYRACTDTGVWPGYSSAVETLCLPRWAVNDSMEEAA